MADTARVGCLSLSYNSAPVDVREHLAGALADIELVAIRAQEAGTVQGFVTLATCNRIEFYGHLRAASRESIASVLQGIVAVAQGVESRVLSGYADQTEGVDSARHLFRVAAGLASMVLGEPQIQGQVAEALRKAEAVGLASPLLKMLFQMATKAGKRARAETGLSRNPVSVASVAVDLALREAGPIDRVHVTVLGAGEMAGLVAKLLKARGVHSATIVNRTVERGAALADRFHFEARAVSSLPEVLRRTDVVISATRAPHTVVEPAHLDGQTTPLIAIDLAVPRDINPAVGELPGVSLFDIDNMRDVVESSLEMRRREIPAAEAIIEQELGQFELRQRTLKVEPVIAGLRRKAEVIRQEELTRAFGELDALSPEAREQLQFFSHALINKLLHEPTRRLRERAATAEAEGDSALVRSLFAL